MAGTKELNCNCVSEFQDKQYGKSKRIFNLNQDNTKAKCTVCNNIKNLK